MKIIFFDGNCPICHSWVKRIIRWDSRKLFSFSPLEGELAKKLLTPLLPDYTGEDTIIFYEEGQIFLRSDAAIAITRLLGFPYNLALAGRMVPKVIRDGIYRWVASRRFRYGQRYEECPLPPAGWRDRFI